MYTVQDHVIPSSNAFALRMRQWVQHTVMRVNRWQAALVQLILNNLYQLLHSRIILAPVTHNLQTVGQVTVCIWEVRFQLEGCTVGLDSFWYVSRIFVN